MKLKSENVIFGALDDVCFRDKFGLAVSRKVDLYLEVKTYKTSLNTT
jgi:hypothetical protein